MKILLRLITAFAVALAGLVGLAGPASAAGPETIYISAGPVPPTGTVDLIGIGCPALSAISFDVWDTTSGDSHRQYNNVTTADEAGQFTYIYEDLEVWDAGDELGFRFSCSDPFSAPGASDPSADNSYVQIQLADPFVEIVAPTISRYGVARQVVVRNDDAFGTTTLTVDGTPLASQPGSYVGWTVFRLPVRLSIGTHTLQATFDPLVEGSPTVTDTHSLRVTRALSRTTLRSSVERIRKGRAFAIRVTITRTGVAPRTGTVAIKDGSRVIKRITIRASDNGTRRILIRLPRVGPRRVTAVYLGNSKLAPDRSNVVTVRVRH